MAFFPSSSWPPIPDQIAHIAYLWCKNCDTVSILNYKKPIFSKGKWIVTGDKYDTSQWTRYQWEPFSKIANWHHDKQSELKEKELSKDKECPKCAETIKAKAVTCRFCGYDFEKVELKNKSREIEDDLDNDDELDDFVQNQKDLKADIARELNQAKSQIDKIIIGSSGLLKQTTCITLGTFYDPHKSFPPLNNEQISWAFGVCDAYISSLNLDDEESLAYITVCFVDAYGDEMGSKYVGIALKNQIKLKDYVKQGGQSAHDFLRNNIFPIMPKS
jgi:hypothetical protein